MSWGRPGSHAKIEVVIDGGQVDLSSDLLPLFDPLSSPQRTATRR